MCEQPCKVEKLPGTKKFKVGNEEANCDVPVMLKRLSKCRKQWDDRDVLALA